MRKLSIVCDVCNYEVPFILRDNSIRVELCPHCKSNEEKKFHNAVSEVMARNRKEKNNAS